MVKILRVVKQTSMVAVIVMLASARAWGVTDSSGTVVAGALNDTGITANQCYQAGSNALVHCASPVALALSNAQDGMLGRDTNATTNLKIDGKLGLSFTSVAGGCVQDNVTGLMWEVKTADGGSRDSAKTYTNFDSTLSAQKWNGAAAVPPTQAEIDAPTNSIGFKSIVNTQGLCGYHDWRLPSADELQSIVDYGVAFPGPAIDANWFPNTQALAYWTDSSSVGYIIFNNGFVGIGASRNGSFNVRLVRAGQLSKIPRYTLSADGQEVTDSQTRLIWRRCTEGLIWNGTTCTGKASPLSHEAALQHASAQATSNGIPWRLPNIKELSSIADKNLHNPATDPSAFPATPAYCRFWSATPVVGNPSQAWDLVIYSGSVNDSNRGRGSCVRLVRDGQ